VAELVVGPLLRYVGDREATMWVETDAACEVQVLGRRERTFCVEGHHYALVMIEDLEPGAVYEYEVALDGEPRWPPPGSDLPPSAIRTLDPGAPIRLAFGSCRVSVPHDAPYNLSKDDDARGREVDALYALALRMIDQPMEEWPQVLLLLGDQVYADEVSPEVREFILSRRDVRKPPGDEIADFEEYTRLYWESWREPVFRWLASTVSTAMIFDDHDVHDDWNTSRTWVDDIRREPWWDERVTSGLVSYWIYQHIGNLSPRELRDNGMLAKVQEADDAGPFLRRFAFSTERAASGWRWSYHRDLGQSRLIVMDSRAGRVLEEGGRRTMVDDSEWAWITEHSAGDFDHLLYATSLPYLLSPGMHFMEAWNERLCDGVWGKTVANLSEKLRQAVDLEHWAAFGESFERLTSLFCEVGSGRRGQAPASIVALSGDVHHAYLAEVAFRRDAGVASAVYQAVCSPVRNPLGAPERAFMRAAASPAMLVVGRALATAAGVPDPGIRWRLDGGQKFDNQIATLDLDGRTATLTLERTQVGSTELYESLHRRLA
jgi:hypothetical protein